MKALGLDGQIYNLELKLNKNEKKSQLHLKARDLLIELFPLQSIYEEIKIPKQRLFVDFFIPQKLLVVEVHGEQHYKYNNYFFNNKLEYFEALKRDNLKIEWCNINNFNICILPFNEINNWRNIIESRNS